MSLGRRSELGLAGEEAEAGRPGIPGVDDYGARDEVVQGTVLPLHEDAQEPRPKSRKLSGNTSARTTPAANRDTEPA